MPRLTLSLFQIALMPEASVTLPVDGPAVVLAHDQTTWVNAEKVATGEGVFAAPGANLSNSGINTCVALAFVLSAAAIDGATAHEQIDVTFPCLLRLDEVAFPPGAQAYRHVHTGPGFRHLRWGALALTADDHSFDAAPGDTWFEAANSPVRAIASLTEPETRFVRCMVLPPEFAGKPTINILDPAEADLPRRQVTHRHVDHLLTQWPYVDAG